MELVLKRVDKAEDAMIGELYVDGAFECWTLERTDKLIPTGTYRVELYDSPKNGRVVPQLLNVVGRKNIQIHIANYARELEGCIAVGKKRFVDYVSQSKVAFESLMSKLQGQTDITITIS